MKKDLVIRAAFAFSAFLLTFASTSVSFSQETDRIFVMDSGQVDEISPPGIYVLPNSLPQSSDEAEGVDLSDMDGYTEELSDHIASPSLLDKAKDMAMDSMESVENFVDSFASEDVLSPDEELAEREVLMDEPFEMHVRLINKRLGRVEDFTLLPEQPVQFGNMIFLGRHCLKDYKDVEGSDVGYVNALNIKTGESLFAGWLYTLTPGVTGMSHPVYELKLMSCRAV